MARCPFATWDPIHGGLGAYSGGPFKIIHHTTEGNSYAQARSAFQSKKADPHFTVDASNIYQHIDTLKTARSLKNPPGGVETNRRSAIQIELVGFAGRPKNPDALANVARLCRWIESTHAVPQRWPNGFPRFSTNGRDPGGHNRNSQNWVTEGGHYGHSQVPENDHWDPGYTPSDVGIVTPEAVMPVRLMGAMAETEMVASPELQPSANELTGATEHLLSRLLDLLSPLASQSSEQRLFFPEGIRDVELSVKASAIEVHLKLSGGGGSGS